MDQHPNNPTSNALGAGVTDAHLLEAVNASGYPVQSVAVDRILGQLDKLIKHPEGEGPWNYSIQEEWSYSDADSGGTRNLDALIEANIPNPVGDPYHPVAANPQSTVRNSLAILLECKKSNLPYVFFLRPCAIGDVPKLIGLPHETILIDSSNGFSFSMSTFDVLGLYDLSFTRQPVTAISMSKAHRKGKDALELSGDEAFRAITLPLLKASQHYSRVSNSKNKNRLYHDIRTILPVAVLNAPMVGVKMENGQTKLEALPWVRLIRVDPGKHRGRVYSSLTAIEIVHIDYLEEFVRSAYQCAAEVAARVCAFTVPILTGKAIDTPHDDNRSGTEEPAYLTMKAHQSDQEFMNSWRSRFREVHAQT